MGRSGERRAKASEVGAAQKARKVTTSPAGEAVAQDNGEADGPGDPLGPQNVMGIDRE